jgi:hypothetical protein
VSAPRARGLAALASLVALLGCGSTVEDVCETIADECGASIVESTCVRDGLELEEVAENVECEASFDDHLDCLDDAVCAWETACDQTLQVVLECVTGI